MISGNCYLCLTSNWKPFAKGKSFTSSFPFGLYDLSAGFCEGTWLVTLVNCRAASVFYSPALIKSYNEAELMRSLLSVLSLHIWIKHEPEWSRKASVSLRRLVLNISGCFFFPLFLLAFSGFPVSGGLGCLSDSAECLTTFLHIFKAERLTSASAFLCKCAILWQTVSVKQIDEQWLLFLQLFHDMIAVHHNIIIGSQLKPCQRHEKHPHDVSEEQLAEWIHNYSILPRIVLLILFFLMTFLTVWMVW